MGTCFLCNGNYVRRVMSSHIQHCGLPKTKASAAVKPAKKSHKPSFHIFVEGRDSKLFWMHLAVRPEAELAELDGFLRKTWLECCDHASAFTIQGKDFACSPSGDSDEDDEEIRLCDVLQPGMELTHEYDFGSTTHLKLKVVGPREGVAKESGMQLLARNDMHEFYCELCESLQPKIICPDCALRGKGWMCEACAAVHECDPDSFRAIRNSPRVGICRYGSS